MNRIKQFIFYMFSVFYKVDKDFLNLYLNKKELYYFNKLLKRCAYFMMLERYIRN